MTKAGQRLVMDTFTPIHEPDEGYSEDPLNPPVHQSLAISLTALRSPADLQLWLASNALALPLSVKKGERKSGAPSLASSTPKCSMTTLSLTCFCGAIQN